MVVINDLDFPWPADGPFGPAYRAFPFGPSAMGNLFQADVIEGLFATLADVLGVFVETVDQAPLAGGDR